jgi:hypothetical protein
MPHRSSREAEGSLPEELLQFYREPVGQILLVRGPRSPAGTALGAAVMGKIPGPGVILAAPGQAQAYRIAFGSTAVAAGWSVVEAKPIVPAEIRTMARAVAEANRLLVDAQRDGVLSALWLPPAILDALSRLPEDGTGILVVDSWDEIVSMYAPDDLPGRTDLPSRMELESFLVGSLRRFSKTHVALVATAPASALLPLVDGIIDVEVEMQGGRIRGSFRVTRARGWTVDRRDVDLALDSGDVRWTPPP